MKKNLGGKSRPGLLMCVALIVLLTGILLLSAACAVTATHEELKTIAAAAEGYTGPYDGKAHGITVSVTDPADGAVIRYGKTEGTCDLMGSPTITDVADSPLTVYYRITADGYETKTDSETVTLSKAANPMQAAPFAGVMVGGYQVDLSENVISAEGAVTYTITGALSGCSVDETIGVLTSGNKPGVCTVRVTAAGNENYESTEAEISVFVTEKLAQTLAFEEKHVTKTCGDEPFVNPLSGAKTTVTYDVEVGTDVASVAEDGTVTLLEAGKAVIVAVAEETELYAKGSAIYLLDVEEPSLKTIAATAAGYAGTYDGMAHGITVSVTDPAYGAMIRYGKTEGTYDLTVSPTITNAADSPLTVYYQITADGYETKTGSERVLIAKADNPMQVAPFAGVMVGGYQVDLSGNVIGAEGDVTYAFVEAPDGCTLDAGTGMLTSGSESGVCTISVTADGNGNYKKSTAEITVYITEKQTQTLVFEEEHMTKTYGDAPFVNPLSGARTAVTYEVEVGSDVVSVADDGTVTLLKAGKAVIVAVAEETELYAKGSAVYLLDVVESSSEPEHEDPTPVPADPAPVSQDPAQETPETPAAADLTDISGAEIVVEDQVYKKKKAYTPEPIVRLGETELVSGQDYTVGYSHNRKIGTATVTVTGTGAYTGTAQANFRIVPKGTKLGKLIDKNKILTVTWNKAGDVTGYEIQYSTKKDFSKGKKTVRVTDRKASSTTVRNMKTGKTYYFRIRVWKKAGGKKYFSAWSKVKKVKIR